MLRLPTILRALALLLTMAMPLRAQSGVVHGTVSDEAGRPLAAARVSVAGTTLATESRSDGTFDLRAVPNGARVVRAQRIGYRAESVALDVRAGAVGVARFVLRSDPLALDAVVVSGTYNPASKLESSTAITTISAQQIQEQAPRGMAELLKSVPGFQVMSNSGE